MVTIIEAIDLTFLVAAAIVPVADTCITGQWSVYVCWLISTRQ
jgi:hypothetical protein